MTLVKAQIVKELYAQKIFTKTRSARIIETRFELTNDQSKMAKIRSSANLENSQ